jgi:Malectin domain
MDRKSIQFFVLLAIIGRTVCKKQVVFAINYGGDAVTGSDGVQYQTEIIGDQLVTNSLEGDDRIYRTQISGRSISRDLPILEDGDYTLNLKFYEDNEESNQLNVWLNGEHNVIENLYISDEAGTNEPYDYNITFNVVNERIEWNDETSDVVDQKINLKLRSNGRCYISAVVLYWEPFPVPDVEEVTIDESEDPLKSIQKLLLRIIENQEKLIELGTQK